MIKKCGLIAFLFVLCLGLNVRGIGYTRRHWKVETSVVEYLPSERELKNPNCGFYYMHGFYITEEDMDFRQEIAKRYSMDEDTMLTMVQINLAHFRSGEITSKGLENIEALFDALQSVDKQLIVRFLYDWDGNCKGKEPEQLEIILRHMEQVGPIVKAHKEQILTLQGLFVGNWGEMNGTPYTEPEDVQRLAETLFAATEGSVYLAVRMPMFWRRAIPELGTVSENGVFIESRLGLYNDGMLGSFSDYGTYGINSKADSGRLYAWNREEELDFQDTLCAYVPQGGEVIIDNDFNDIENAIHDFQRMHVSYLNRDCDKSVYDKWKSQQVHTEDSFDGMDGFSYVERHIGYRLAIETPQMSYDPFKDQLTCSLTIRNEGFAPIYKNTEKSLRIVNLKSGEIHSYRLDFPLKLLYGGAKDKTTMTRKSEICLSGLASGEYEIYLWIEDVDSGKPIELANDHDLEEYGYPLGKIVLQ